MVINSLTVPDASINGDFLDDAFRENSPEEIRPQECVKLSEIRDYIKYVHVKF